MDKRGDITESTPDVEERLRDKRAADDPTSKIRELDDDVSKRLAEKAAARLTRLKKAIGWEYVSGPTADYHD